MNILSTVYVLWNMATDGATRLPSPAEELAQLRQENERLNTSLRQSSQENELLRAERQQLLEQHQQSTRTIESLQHRLQELLRRLFGRSSEKVDPKQMLLFEELLDQLAPRTECDATSNEAEVAAAAQAASPRGNGGDQGKGHGRGRLPRTLPRETVYHDLPEDAKPCPCCGELRHVIGQDVSEQLDYVPAHAKVIEHVRLKYACPSCEANAAEGGPQITTAEKPLAPIEKGLAAPGLLAYVIVSKYGDHLPLHRLERILDRHGIQIARSTMCDWMAQCANLLRPLHELMSRKVRDSKVIHTDDTPVDVLDRNLDRTRTGRFWVYIGDPDHPLTVFDYTPSRSRDGPWQFLQGWGKESRVYLQADAFGGYDGLYAGETGGQVTEVACWAHARRKFYEARTSDAEASAKALAYIRLLYEVEDRAKEQFAQPGDVASAADKQHESLASIRLRLRQELAVPRLEQFRAWLQSQQAERGGPVLPKSPMGQAITYALNQWEALGVYTTDGALAIDNNSAENALRRVAIGRKNSYDLLSSTVRDVRRSDDLGNLVSCYCWDYPDRAWRNGVGLCGDATRQGIARPTVRPRREPRSPSG